MPDEVEEATLPGGRPGAPAGADRASTSACSRSEARRLLAQGGVRLDGEPLEAALDVPAERLDGAVLQLGKRAFKRFGGPRPS